MHDPLALAAALDPTLVTTEPVTVDVELTGALTGGQTVADWRHHWGRPPNMDVAVAVRAGDFLERFIERVGALAASRCSPGRQAATYAARCSPVTVERAATRSAGEPSKTTRPPSWPAPGPRSMIQSACAMTAR